MKVNLSKTVEKYDSERSCIESFSNFKSVILLFNNKFLIYSVFVFYVGLFPFL